MADYVYVEITVAARHIPKLKALGYELTGENEECCASLYQDGVAWGDVSAVKELGIPFYGSNEAKYEIEPMCFASDGKTFIEVQAHQNGDPACTFDRDGKLHGTAEASQYWRIRKRAEVKMRRRPRSRKVAA